MKSSYDYAALKFLMLWERTERSLHEALNGVPSAKEVRQCLKHFQVARTFTGIRDDSKALSVAEMLGKAGARRGSSPEEKVAHLACLFKKEFGSRNLSAASKLMWLRFREPFVILDSRAVDAIAAKVQVASFESYSHYVQAWRDQYTVAKPKIADACLRLESIKSHIGLWRESAITTESLVREPWFQERVFDIYLWEFGNDDA